MRALELDKGLAEAHTALALIVQNYDFDWVSAETEFQRAIELNPNYATAHHWYAEHLALLGRFDEAFRESERARRLDPLSLIIATDNGAILYFSRQYDRAIEQFRAVLDMDPGYPRGSIVVHAYEQKGMFAEAMAEVEKRTRGRPDAAWSTWSWVEKAHIYGRSGKLAEARHALDRLQQIYRRRPADAYGMVWAWSGIDKEQTLAWLEKAYTQHSNVVTTLKVEPAFDWLRGDPRFQDLMRRVRLAP